MAAPVPKSMITRTAETLRPGQILDLKEVPIGGVVEISPSFLYLSVFGGFYVWDALNCEVYDPHDRYRFGPPVVLRRLAKRKWEMWYDGPPLTPDRAGVLDHLFLGFGLHPIVRIHTERYVPEEAA